MIPSKSACCSECVQPTFIDPAFGGGKAYNACGNIFCKCHSPSQEEKIKAAFPKTIEAMKEYPPSHPKKTLRSKCCKSTMSTSCADEGTCCYICDECQKPCDWISDFDKFIAASQPAESDYSKHDHGHCWESKKPPCGQKIKHFECCLCQEPHPEIQKSKSEGIEQGRIQERNRMRMEIGRLEFEVLPTYAEENGYSSALDDMGGFLAQ